MKNSDEEINHAQKLLKSQSPKLNGLKLTLYQEKVSVQATTNWLQIIHCRQRDRWILGTIIGCNKTMVLLYDSVLGMQMNQQRKYCSRCFLMIQR